MNLAIYLLIFLTKSELRKNEVARFWRLKGIFLFSVERECFPRSSVHFRKLKLFPLKAAKMVSWITGSLTPLLSLPLFLSWHAEIGSKKFCAHLLVVSSWNTFVFRTTVPGSDELLKTLQCVCTCKWMSKQKFLFLHGNCYCYQYQTNLCPRFLYTDRLDSCSEI